ncbi:MAG: MotA/TolQ/ExbB proton channel family protein [Gammaproteobacteria bacterium]|jgi:biopolymer transport protein ExbB
MIFLQENLISPIRDFFEAGGDVLFAILFVTILMWTLIIERLWFFYFVLPGRVKAVQQTWDARSDTFSWYARQVRQQLISEVGVECRHYLPVIKALMAILPLLGLLGTVTGMISVFDVMAFAGTGNARLMAAGVSKATIPTMSGLVAALSGLYFASWLEQKSIREVGKIEDLLAHH